MTDRPAEDWEIRVLYDGDCPLCAREARWLERLDAGRGRIQLEDLSAPEFDPQRYDLDQATVEARIHGILPDGRVVEGVDVFARAYRAVGMTWLAAISEWRGVRWILDRLYLLFARNRLWITGRSPQRCSGTSGACSAPPEHRAGTAGMRAAAPERRASVLSR